MFLHVAPPTSAGIFLTYKCSSRCQHCMYACGPGWPSDWISDETLQRTLHELAKYIEPWDFGFDLNRGLHLSGGEPFLNFDLLLQAVRHANQAGIDSVFVETNSSWCKSQKEAEKKLEELKKAGLKGILISCNPFLVEFVPFSRIVTAVRAALSVFGNAVAVYQYVFFEFFSRLGLTGTLRFDDFLAKYKGGTLLRLSELIPMGRAVYRLGYLYQRRPASAFFFYNCREELTRGWHAHVDNYGNYITGFCAGISLGKISELTTLIEGIELDEFPIVSALYRNLGALYELATELGYEERADGYCSKCHLCLDIRLFLVRKFGGKFKELQPLQYYRAMEKELQG